MTGSLRDDLFARLEEWEEKCDLTLAMGTSLCGMAADCVVETVSRKFCEQASRRGGPPAAGEAGCTLGSVIVGFQQTAHDERCSLRIFADIDKTMALLARALGVQGDVRARGPDTERMRATSRADSRADSLAPTHAPPAVGKIGGNDVFRVPYDAAGRRTDDPTRMRAWSLAEDARVKVTAGPGRGYVGTVLGRNAEGHFKVRLPIQREGSKLRGTRWTVYTLGSWWVDAAVRGEADRLPLVNTEEPAVLPRGPPAARARRRGAR
jgi:hypothetical protein